MNRSLGMTAYTGSAVNGQKLVQTTNSNIYTNGCISIPACFGANYISKSLSTTSLFATGSQPPIYTQTQSIFNQLGGKPTAIKEWDYQASVDTANPPTTTPARETDYTYTGNDVHTVSVLDGNGNQAGQTTYAYASTATVTSGVPQHGSQNGGGPYLQSESHLLNTGSATITTSTMDDTGQVVGGQDADLHPATVISYQCSNSLPYQVSNALKQTTTSVYDCNSGAIQSMADPNDTAARRAGTTYTYEPAAGRIQIVTSPDTGKTTYTYPSATEVDTTVAASPDPANSSVNFLDSFGRNYQHIQYENDRTNETTSSETTYDANGRPYCVTNPHAWGASTTASTCVTSYDGLDRPLVQQQPDGTSTLQWSYSQNTTTSTDESGNQMQRTSDAFGHLKSVSEILSGGSS